MKKQHIYSILAGLAIAAGLWWLLFSLPNQAANEADVTVQGTILSSTIDEDFSAESGKTYQPEVTYRYQYDGQTYENDNVEAGGITQNYQDRSDARSIVSKYPEEEKVTVHVNSNDPAQAFLQPPSHGLLEYVLVLFPLLFAGLAAYAGLKGW